ncbi:MAG: WG repeat-containing protein [Clostridiales Family XIII bacterium]|jgi:hypothetical protein|nr:WG repeat-containing protein [Clostridiales Family XIII bacterium]
MFCEKGGNENTGSSKSTGAAARPLGWQKPGGGYYAPDELAELTKPAHKTSEKHKKRIIAIVLAAVLVTGTVFAGIFIIPRLYMPDSMPRNFRAAEIYIDKKFTNLESIIAEKNYLLFYETSLTFESLLFDVIQSEETNAAYPPNVIGLAIDAKERLYALNINKGRELIAALWEKGDLPAMEGFYNPAMLNEENQNDILPKMFNAFRENGDFAGAEKILRKMLEFSFTRETVRLTLNYMASLGEEDITGWSRLSMRNYDMVTPFENGRAFAAVYIGEEGDEKLQWGLIDADGNELTAPVYDAAEAFLQGRAAVRKDGKWGFIGIDGEEIIAPLYDDIKRIYTQGFEEYAVNDRSKTKMGYYEGFAPVQIDGAWGFIDMDGNPIGEGFIYDDVWYFNEGVAAVETDGGYGLIDRFGEFIIEPGEAGRNGISFDAVRPIHEGLAGVSWNQQRERGIINKYGELAAIFDMESIELIEEYNEGFASVRQDYGGAPKWGFINRYGETVVPIRYDYVSPFSSGLAKVGTDGKYGLIDGKGELVAPIVYDEIGEFYEGAAYIIKNGKIGFIKSNGKLICDTIYESAANFSGGAAAVCYNGMWGAIDLNGVQTIGYVFDELKRFSCGAAPARLDDKWGYIDVGGYFIVPPIFDDASELSERIGAVIENGQCRLIRGIHENAYVVGRVADEDNTPAARAAVKFYDVSDLMMYEPLCSAYTDENGIYRLWAPEGEYKIVVSAEGYERSTLYENIEIINGNIDIFAAPVILVEAVRADAEGVAKVNIADAFTGDGIEGAAVRFRKGLDNTVGAWVRGADSGVISVNTDIGGRFSVRLPHGAYTAEVSMPGYVTAHVNFTVSDSSGNREIATRAMTKELPPGEIRVILEWGAKPKDLDAHLLSSAPGSTEKVHIYYPAVGGGADDAALENDCSEGNGFETMTIYMRQRGAYEYCVFDHTNGENYASAEMSAAIARVSVYRDAVRAAVYDVPVDCTGNLWNVFRVDDGEIAPVNEVTAGLDLAFYTY